MSTPDPAPEKNKLWISDSELIELLGVPEKKAREALRTLDRVRSGFPPREKIWGDRRYRPAVEAYFEKHYGGTLTQPKQRERA